MLTNRLRLLEERIGYCFQDKKLLRQALTHSSCSNEQKINKLPDYERLEFLGDAVLELVSSDHIFRENPEMSEGELTKFRSSIVCEPALAFCARQIGLEEFILLGRGEELTGGRKRDSIISDVMEATIGAIYLDSGIEEARAFIGRFILSDLEQSSCSMMRRPYCRKKSRRRTAACFVMSWFGRKGRSMTRLSWWK